MVRAASATPIGLDASELPRSLANCGIPGVVAWPGRDGVNLWIHLPSGFDAGEVIERGAALGVLVAPGEVFYLSPGHSDVCGSMSVRSKPNGSGLR